MAQVISVTEHEKMHAFVTFELHGDGSNYADLRANPTEPNTWVPSNGPQRRAVESESNLWRYFPFTKIVNRVDARIESCADEDRWLLHRLLVCLTVDTKPLIRCPILDLLEPDDGDLAQRVAYLERVVHGLLLKDRDEPGLEAMKKLGAEIFTRDPRAIDPAILIENHRYFYPSVVCDGPLEMKSPIIIRVTLRGVFKRELK